MNSHIKLAYQAGVQQALEDAGITKTARSLLGPLANIAGGGVTGATAANMALPENATTGERIMAGLGGAALGAGGALTGYDRFGLRGALGGAGLASGIGYGLSRLAPEGEGVLNMAGRALASGTSGSLGASLLSSSLMPGASLRAAAKSLALRRFGKDQVELMLPTVRSTNLGRPMSESARMWAAESGQEVHPLLMRILRGMDYNTGSPTMAATVRRHGSIDKVPAGEYIRSNLKDTALGTAVGAAALPLALPGQALAEIGLRESRAEQGGLTDKLKFLADQGRVPGAPEGTPVIDQARLLAGA